MAGKIADPCLVPIEIMKTQLAGIARGHQRSREKDTQQQQNADHSMSMFHFDNCTRPVNSAFALLLRGKRCGLLPH
jgi:hypothetical protein